LTNSPAVGFRWSAVSWLPPAPRYFLMALCYFLILTPVGLIVRLVRDPLNRNWRPEQDSYWIDVGAG
jgi:hypothetical protein